MIFGSRVQLRGSGFRGLGFLLGRGGAECEGPAKPPSSTLRPNEAPDEAPFEAPFKAPFEASPSLPSLPPTHTPPPRDGYAPSLHKEGASPTGKTFPAQSFWGSFWGVSGGFSGTGGLGAGGGLNPGPKGGDSKGDVG